MLLFFMYLQSLSQIMNGSMDELARCPGIGERKVLQHAHVGYPFDRNCKLLNPVSLA
jgi:hypothetical protein